MAESTQEPVAEWTEHNAKRGLDPLGMQTSSIRLYQSLVPGISNVTLRMRYYGLYPWLCLTYARRIGHTDPTHWRTFVRRAEALYALLATRGKSAAGVAGVNWAQQTLDAAGERIDFAPAADLSEGPTYLKRAAFDAAYRTQLFEVGILAGTTQHDIPLPSNLGEELADAFGAALGTVAEQLFDIVQRGWASPSELDRAAAAMPSAIPVAGPEATLYGRLLLEADQSRGCTATLLLAVAGLLDREPTPDDFRWIMYAGSDSSGCPLALDAGAGGYAGDALATQREQWWMFQANDLCHVAYEALLKYMLDVLADHPAGMAPRRLVEQCAEGIIAAVDGEPDTWRTWIASTTPAQNAYAEDDPASEFALGALAMGAGRDHRRQCGPEHGVAALRLLGTLHRRLEDEEHDLDVAFGRLPDPLFRSLLTERRFLDQRHDDNLRSTLFALLEERILGRHLWVALRKLRYQNDYTFLVEMDDGLVRLRALDGPVYTTPRIGSALAFLRDCHLVDANGLTQQGLAALNR